MRCPPLSQIQNQQEVACEHQSQTLGMMVVKNQDIQSSQNMCTVHGMKHVENKGISGSTITWWKKGLPVGNPSYPNYIT